MQLRMSNLRPVELLADSGYVPLIDIHLHSEIVYGMLLMLSRVTEMRTCNKAINVTKS